MVPVRKMAPQPDRSQDPAPSYGDGLCSCGSDKPVLSTGRCRSCAAKLANETRKRKASRATAHDMVVLVHIVAQQLALSDDQRDAGEMLFQLRRPIHHRGRGSA